MTSTANPEPKIPLTTFLKMLGGVPQLAGAKSMGVARKIYKTHNTSEALSTLTEFALEKAGVEDKEERKHILAAVHKAGYKSSAPTRRPLGAAAVATSASVSSSGKRKRDGDVNELLPKGEDDDSCGSLSFNEILDPEALKGKSAVVNRAPLMTAWASVVAESLGFTHEEALSIASVYTETNAIAKGARLGVHDRRLGEYSLITDGSQPFVELMGRRIPLYRAANEQWRALTQDGNPVPPTGTHAYVTRALRQTAPHIVGALYLLARSYHPRDLNERGFALYADFRPNVKGWGGRAQVQCDKILELRRLPQDDDGKDSGTEIDGKTGTESVGAVRAEENVEESVGSALAEEPVHKKMKTGDSVDEADVFDLDDFTAEELGALP